MTRSNWRITLSVWNALLLREAVARMFGRRAAVVWLLLEPAFNILFMIFIFTVLRTRHVGGMDMTLWLIAGFLPFFLFRRTANQGAAAVGANLALYTYRQVKPVDGVLVRCFLEALLMFLVSALVLTGAWLWGVPMPMHAPLEVFGALLGLWLLGLAYGLAVSVATELTPELANILNMLMMPLMIISGVILPLQVVPVHVREWLMLNPVAHGVEGVRAGLAPYYHAVPELSLSYLYGVVLVLLFFGLALHARYQRRLVAL